MARRTTITDDQILKAAREVFLQEGIRGQTAVIAKLAGVSEGSIFKRFETKHDLFFAALSIPYPPAWHKDLENLTGEDVKEDLTQIGVWLLTYFQETLPRIMVANGIKAPPPPPPMPGDKEFENSPLQRDAKVLASYLDHLIEDGRLKKTDSKILTALLLGAFTTPIFHEILNNKTQTIQDFRDFSEKTIELLWRGLGSREQ